MRETRYWRRCTTSRHQIKSSETSSLSFWSWCKYIGYKYYKYITSIFQIYTVYCNWNKPRCPQQLAPAIFAGGSELNGAKRCYIMMRPWCGVDAHDRTCLIEPLNGLTCVWFHTKQYNIKNPSTNKLQIIHHDHFWTYFQLFLPFSFCGVGWVLSQWPRAQH